LAHLHPSPIPYHDHLARQPPYTALYRLSTLEYSPFNSYYIYTNDTTLDSPTAPLRQESTLKKKHGRRTPEIQTFVAQQLAPSSSAQKPRHIPLQERDDIHNMAQGSGSPAFGREVDHLGQEEHRCQQEKGSLYLLRMSLSLSLPALMSISTFLEQLLTKLAHRNPTLSSPNSSAPSVNAS
jgi:hypothetical protein